MSRGVSLAGLLLAWLCAQGTLTEAVQVFAWGRMFTGYAQRMSWAAAVRETFDPNKPCELCCAVRHVRDADEKSPAPPPGRESGRLDLFVTTAGGRIAPDIAPDEFLPIAVVPTEWCAPVPKPPPRMFRA